MNGKIILLGVIAVIVVAGIALSVAGGASKFASDQSPVWYFYRDDCHFCQQQKPILEDLALEGYRVKLVDLNAQPALWQQYGITGTPTFVADNGQGERLEGLTQKAELKAYFDRNGAKVAANS
ncbi:thioredoxin family protein [Candidatus Micrarchaeota archaeon]|nr:thioredoxin family protein [Candidatus Micrarchaeota archaeon]